MKSFVRAQLAPNPMHRGQLPASSCRHVRVDGLQRPSGRNAYPSGITPSTIMSPTRRRKGSRTEIRLGVRAHNTRTTYYAHAPPDSTASNSINSDPALDTGTLHR